MPPGRDKPILAGAALAAALLLAACSRHDPPISSGVLRISQRNEPADLDPATASLPDEYFIIRALSQGLVVPSGLGPPRPGAARSWDVSPDGLRYTFHLHNRAVWSNGDPVTAADFVASFRRVLSPSTPAPKADLFFGVRNAEAYYRRKLSDFGAVGFTAADAHTLTVTLEEPNPHFLDYAASGPWIPVDPRVVQSEGRNWTKAGHYVGNGAFVLEEWLPGQRIVVRKSASYRQARNIRVERIQFVRFDDNDSEERAYRAGDVDVTMTVPYSKLPVYARDHPADLHRQALAETRYLAFNTQRRPLSDPRVRRALSLAIDRRRIVEDVLLGGQKPAQRLIPPAVAEFPELGTVDGAAPAAPARGAALARALMRGAGYPDGRNFPVLELTGWSLTPVLEVIQAMWKKELGIEVRVSVREARAHFASLRAGQFDIAFAPLIPDVADPLSVLENYVTGSPNNYPHWSDPAYDALVAGAARTAYPAVRTSKMQAAESRLLDAMPIAPLYVNAQSWLMRPYVRGWEQDALWNRYYDGLWLDKNKIDAPFH